VKKPTARDNSGEEKNRQSALSAAEKKKSGDGTERQGTKAPEILAGNKEIRPAPLLSMSPAKKKIHHQEYQAFHQKREWKLGKGEKGPKAL